MRQRRPVLGAMMAVVGLFSVAGCGPDSGSGKDAGIGDDMAVNNGDAGVDAATPADLVTFDMWQKPWVAVTSPVSTTLYSVWSYNTSPVYAAGSLGKLLKSADGTTWVEETSNTTETLRTVTGNGTGVIAVGGNGNILKPSGSQGDWAAEVSNAGGSNLYGAYVAPMGTPGISWAVGANGTIVSHAAGVNTWATVAVPNPPNIDNVYGVWGSAGTSVYAAVAKSGGGGAIWHTTAYNVAFTAQTVPANTPQLLAIGGHAAKTDIYAVGELGAILHSTGNGVWTAQTSGVTTNLQAVSANGLGDVYVVGDSGVILHTTNAGANWYPESIGTTTVDLNGVWSGPTQTYVVGSSGKIYRK